MPQHFRVYDPAHAHFITSTITHWIPVFSRQDYFAVLVDSVTYCVENKGLVVYGFVIMPHHFHMVSSQRDGMLSETIRDLKKHTSKQIARKLEEDARKLWLTAFRRAAGAEGGFRVWEESFHPEQVHSRAFFEQKLTYMHNNPVRAGYVDDPCAWKYSSAGFYYRDEPSCVPILVPEW